MKLSTRSFAATHDIVYESRCLPAFFYSCQKAKDRVLSLIMKQFHSQSHYAPTLLGFCAAIWILGQTCAFAADKNTWAKIEERTQKLWNEEDFEALEQLAAEYRRAPMRITSRKSAINTFYTSIDELKPASDEEAEKKAKKYNRWLEAFPDSVTARTAQADFLISEAWRARGSDWASEVSPEAWPVFKERLQEASAILYSPGMDVKIEPVIARLRVVVEMGGVLPPGTLVGFIDPDITRHCLESYRHWPDYLPTFTTTAHAITPRWGGEPGAVAGFASTSAQMIPEESRDAFYAQIARLNLNMEKEAFFTISKFDIPRVLRGLSDLARDTSLLESRYFGHLSAYIAANAGMEDEARRRIYDLGPNMIPPTAYKNDEGQYGTWKQLGIMENLQQGIDLEREGKLAEAEEFYRSLTDADPNPWLVSLASRNNLPHLWVPEITKTATPDKPLTAASMNEVYDLVLFHTAAGNFADAKEYALKYDAQRGHNITGKTALMLVALSEKDPESFEKHRQAFLNLKSNRQNYVHAQAYARGEFDLEETLKKLVRDEHRTISLAMMATIALSQARMDEVDRIVQYMHRQRPLSSNSGLVESFGWGGIRRASDAMQEF
jgi:hypothetical protein